MNLAILDPYREGKSPIHCMDARVKLVATVAFVLAINLTPIEAWPVHLAYLLVVIVLDALAQVSPKDVFGRSALALPFAIMAGIGMPFVQEGTPVLSISVMDCQITMTSIGVLRFANVMVKSWLSILATITLIFTTHFLEIVKALRSLGIPLVLTSIIALMYRYMYVLLDEAQRLMRAREARSADLDTGKAASSLLWRARVTGYMVGTLFLRTYERSERIYSAMLARGFTGEIRSLRRPVLSSRDVVLGGLSVVVLTIVAILANVYW